jgi:hypothetical protein
MTNTFRVIDTDIIYLSYDEPNAEQNYADLCKKVPWAKRVHGVKGSDSAHKACAKLSETDRFITVDGDNRIRNDFLSQTIDFDANVDLTNKVISWTAKNQINGLMYGNGGLKCWPKEYVLNMRTHENADQDNIHAQVDFCWNTEYIQMNGTFSDIYNNSTPQQAWRAGFREGVKMALDRGMRVSIEDFHKNHWKNLHRLYIWLMVGADVENGMWAIYGARQGLYQTMLTDWDFVNVRDFEYLNNMWKNLEVTVDEENLLEAIEDYGDKLKAELDLPIGVTPLDAGGSLFFKTVYQNPARDNSKQFLDREV